MSWLPSGTLPNPRFPPTGGEAAGFRSRPRQKERLTTGSKHREPQGSTSQEVSISTYTNGNGAATIPPSTTKVITGVSLVHRRLSKTQRAVLAANVTDGLVRYVPTNQQVAAAFGVSHTYVDIARGLSPERREAILAGHDSTSFAELMQPRQLQLKPLAPMCASITNIQLEHVIRLAGTDRVLEVAAAVERS
jgi:hypothetical protein